MREERENFMDGREELLEEVDKGTLGGTQNIKFDLGGFKSN